MHFFVYPHIQTENEQYALPGTPGNRWTGKLQENFSAPLILQIEKCFIYLSEASCIIWKLAKRIFEKFWFFVGVFVTCFTWCKTLQKDIWHIFLSAILRELKNFPKAYQAIYLQVSLVDPSKALAEVNYLKVWKGRKSSSLTNKLLSLSFLASLLVWS